MSNSLVETTRKLFDLAMCTRQEKKTPKSLYGARSKERVKSASFLHFVLPVAFYHLEFVASLTRCPRLSIQFVSEPAWVVLLIGSWEVLLPKLRDLVIFGLFSNELL